MYLWHNCNLSFNGIQLTLYYKDEDDKAMRINLFDSKAKPEYFDSSIAETDALPQLSFILFRKEDLLIPLMKDKNQFGMAHVK